MIRLYNTLTRQKDILEIEPTGPIKIYTCGLTVYSQPHIGNWLGYIYWDTLIRLLRHQGIDVVRTQNITDVGHLTSDDDDGEDKMEKSAKREGKSAWDVAVKYITIAEHEAYDLLKLVRPDHLVRATDLIDKQIDFAKTLEEKGYTYEIPSDGIYFDTSKLTDYGKLAKLDIAGLEAGARVSVEGKRNITDFAVWKFSPKDTKRDMEWDSPWGIGFPGWHLECSVIARETLGDQIDIHTGGIDHIPVHHTNEIAQTESLTGKQFSKIWLHNNHIKVDGQKMSKSLGNILTLSDITEKGYSLMAYKLLALAKHYQTEGNFTWDILDASANRLNNWRRFAVLRHQLHDSLIDDYDKSSDATTSYFASAKQEVTEALSDNLDTPAALATIDATISRLDKADLQKVQRQSLVDFIEFIDEILGLGLVESTPDISDDQKRLILSRIRAREAKDWNLSDELRDELASQGIALNDTSAGTSWYYS